MQINHLHLRVSNVARSAAFYKDFFGLSEHIRHGEVLFITDEQRFDLALAPSDDVEPMPLWFHFGFRLQSGEAVRRLYAKLEQSGVTILEPVEAHDDFVFFRCADPDGYTIEVYWE